ncbi:MAG: DUF692 domain-containing protein [Alphaproteobacteria bacterium]|nr:DUF692 domain-containing protein [Alphaproteobacteria bacterium]
MRPLATSSLPARASAGIGLRDPHRVEVEERRPPVGFLEVHAENYLCGGPRGRALERLAGDYPLSVHAVGLSLGSAAGIDVRHLERVAALVDRLAPALVSEHLSWSGAANAYLNDLLPLPYTEEALAIVARNIDRVQSRLARRILVENPSVYLRFGHSTIPEPEFLAELVSRTDCGILFDVNNLYVNQRNHGLDPLDYMRGLPAAAVGELHLAGHHVNDADGRAILIDDHGAPVCAAVWRLYAQAVRRFPEASTLIEWDCRLPPLAELLAEAAEADFRRAQALAAENSDAQSA